MRAVVGVITPPPSRLALRPPARSAPVTTRERCRRRTRGRSYFGVQCPLISLDLLRAPARDAFALHEQTSICRAEPPPPQARGCGSSRSGRGAARRGVVGAVQSQMLDV